MEKYAIVISGDDHMIMVPALRKYRQWLDMERNNPAIKSRVTRLADRTEKEMLEHRRR